MLSISCLQNELASRQTQLKTSTWTLHIRQTSIHYLCLGLWQPTKRTASKWGNPGIPRFPGSLLQRLQVQAGAHCTHSTIIQFKWNDCRSGALFADIQWYQEPCWEPIVSNSGWGKRQASPQGHGLVCLGVGRDLAG